MLPDGEKEKHDPLFKAKIKNDCIDEDSVSNMASCRDETAI